MTPEQEQAIAIASARARLARAQEGANAPSRVPVPTAGPQSALAPAGAAGAPQSTPPGSRVQVPRLPEPEAPGSWWGPNNDAETSAARMAHYQQRADAGWNGVKDHAIKMGLGVKQIFGGLGEDDKTALRQMETETRADPFGKNRDRAGTTLNMALTAIPASKAANAVASVLPKTLAPVATAAAVSGGQGALLDIGQGDTYKEQMLDKGRQAVGDAKAGALMAGGGQLLTKALTKPFTPKPEAVTLMDENITPTLQQGAEGRMGRFIGGLTSGVMDVSKRQNAEVIDALMKRIAPGLDTTGMAMSEKLSALRHTLGSEEAAMTAGKKYTLSNAERSAIWGAARNSPGSFPESTDAAMASLSRAGPALNSTAPVRMGPARMEQYRGLLQDAINEHAGDGVIKTETRRALTAARESFDNLVRARGLSPEELAQVKSLDQRMGDFLRLQDAAGNPGFHAKPKVSEVLRSYSKMAEDADFAHATSPTQAELLDPAVHMMGLTPNQAQARQMVSAIKKLSLPLAVGAASPTTGAVLAPLYATSLAGQTATGARYLFGQNDWQKVMADVIRKGAPFGAGAGQSLTGEQYAP